METTVTSATKHISTRFIVGMCDSIKFLLLFTIIQITPLKAVVLTKCLQKKNQDTATASKAKVCCKIYTRCIKRKTSATSPMNIHLQQIL